MRTTVVSLLLLALLTVALLASRLPVCSAGTDPPHAPAVRRLLVLDSQRGNPYDEVRTALFAALVRYGYTEGRNLSTTVRFSGNDVREGERILQEELKKPYDVVFVGGTAATLSAKNVLYGKPQPVVFASPTDPVGIGVIRDFSGKPAANFTGVCYPVPVKARLKFIRRLMPKAHTFGLIYADMPQSHSYNSWIQNLLKNDREFKDIKVIFRSVPLVKGENGDRVMAARAKKLIEELDAKVDAYIKPCDQMGTRSNFSEVVFSTSKRPLIGLVRDDVMGKWGATATIYPSHESIGSQSARMIRDLFAGKKTADIVPEWPHQYGVAVDLTKARRFRIEIPVELLQLAGENIVR
ncbi:ABC transporter substrate-binding protein [Geomesophilobacter sediminis]|uniref:ABC transporter substrate-binding protein n=1 Tax=Geomesophilobacter sediminis TaxID=2798584 RepID=A0A8J7JCV9_9BACT|nr:ABC transporter substrate binding protein [Geomesophilobacter sediminis]MBJ6725181.1 hypothetical protein [Geomesophilobacter sediminis]